MSDKTPQEETSIEPREQHALDIPIMDIEELERLTKFVAQVKETLMTAGRDYIISGNKQYTSRSGFAKLAQGFNLSDEILKEAEVFKKELFYGFNFTVRVYNAYGRQATGVGSCTIDEPNLIHHKERPYHDVRSIAYTRAWNRAVSNFVGSADVSAEEMSLGSDFEDRKDVDSDQRTAIVLPANFTTPEWAFSEEVKMQGWDTIENVIETWLNSSAWPNPSDVFEWGHDTVKAWVRNAQGVFFGDSWQPINSNLSDAGFKYSKNEKRWRLNQEDLE